MTRKCISTQSTKTVCVFYFGSFKCGNCMLEIKHFGNCNLLKLFPLPPFEDSWNIFT